MIVALVPAKDRADTVGATVEALLTLDAIDEVLVVDDGSRDETSAVTLAAGARVVRSERNLGKGGALAAGLAQAGHADVYVLVDADVGATATGITPLIESVERGDADLAIGVLPSAGSRGGFGYVRDLSRWGIRRATGMTASAPLSGQRVLRGDLLRSLEIAPRFGVETAMTIDAVRSGARVVELPVEMDHRHTGRAISGFRHRAWQGIDIARALFPRLTSTTFRTAVIAAAFVIACAGVLVGGEASEPTSIAPAGRPAKVVLFGAPRLAWDDIGTGRMPNLDAMVRDGAVAATSVRTLSGRPNTAEGYATLGAGTRVVADDQAGFAFDADSALEGATAADALARRTGTRPAGEVVVVGGPATVRLNDGRFLTSRPGALADELHRTGRRVAVINNADTGYRYGTRASLLRPAAAAAMDRDGSVDAGMVGRDLLRAEPLAPFGYEADHDVVIARLREALRDSDVALVDSGDLDRVAEFLPLASPAVAASMRARTLATTDELLGKVRASVGRDALVLVVSVVPPDRNWHLTPMVAWGKGVRAGYLHSSSTRRVGIVTLTDIAPTVLDALGEDVPPGMVGHPLRYHHGPADLDHLRRLDRDATYREGTYLPLTITYITLQAIVYLLAMIAFARLGGAGRLGTVLRAIVLGISAYPLATFLFRAIPNIANTAAFGIVILMALDALIVTAALRARRHPLSPLAWVLGATVALLAVDVATGARLQTSSLLGYSLHTAARFTGLGNTAFATLAATTVLVGALHVHHAPRRREALVATACLFAFVVLIDGAPSLGSDVGGILTLVPVFGLTLAVLSGRRLTWRMVLVAGGVTLLALVLATGVDMLRPVQSRTHLGRLVADVAEQGWEPFTTTVARKAAVNFRTYRSPWVWALLTIAIYMLYFLGWTRGWRHLLPTRSPLRAGAVGTLAAGLIGYAMNDSGVVVAAVVFVYLGPFLTLVALDRERGDPVVLT